MARHRDKCALDCLIPNHKVFNVDKLARMEMLPMIGVQHVDGRCCHQLWVAVTAMQLGGQLRSAGDDH